MVLTRTGKGKDISKMTDPQVIEELREQIARLSAAQTAANNENECLRRQIASLKAKNKDLRDGNSSGKSYNDHDTQTDQGITPPGDHDNSDAPRPNNNDQNSNINLDLVNGILSHFETLHVSLVLPTYDGENGNPIQFIEKLEKYFIRKKIKHEQKLLVVEDALKGRARVWYEARFSPFISFEHFKRIFNDEFYSLEARMKFKTEWAAKKFKPGSNHCLREYFLEQTRAAKYITPRMDDYEINYTIIKQLPQRVRDALSTVDYLKSDLISQALARLDASYSENYNGNTQYAKSAQQQERQKHTVNQVNHIQRNDSLIKRNNYSGPGRRNYSQDRSRENWREPARSDGNSHFALPDTSRPPPKISNQSRSPNSNDGENSQFQNKQSPSTAHNIRAIQQSEFIQDLAWDVEGEVGEGDLSPESHIMSPRMRAKIFGSYVTVLIDSGSDITCVSQRFYESISKVNTRIPELPVSNLAVGVAVARKTIRIAKKIYLNIQYGNYDIEHTYLVVPGLAADIIVGADFLEKNGGIINFKDKTFELKGKEIPSNLISYQGDPTLNENLEANACRSLQLHILETHKLDKNLNHATKNWRGRAWGVVAIRKYPKKW
ncbi:uncharacterized protein LOC116416172 [Nasonia vitripennis]|uniref:Retropepsins domain-containing protein n=1 Tax=Nasonia vitripennis TaxID=7425 RepID=A0A7M7PZP0_NASVI|nr:uncharacterized protein LOC116416172 [Nasonia vitripennis]